jgi:hypothetical protein
MSAYNHAGQGFVTPLIDKIRQCLQEGRLEDLSGILNALFKSLPYELWQRENEHFYHAIIHLSFSLLGIYVQSQVQTSDGRMDALVQLEDYIYCFEFKLDESAEQAIEQIKEKGYLQPFENDPRKRLAVGVNFSTQMKQVEALKWEEV